MTLPNSTGRFTLVSDTSKKATGAALYQKQDDENRLIAYHSKRLQDAASRYGISELELHGLLINIKAFDHYLRGVEFDALVDHSALLYILTSDKEPPTMRIKKMIEKISQYQCVPDFCKGKEMYIADFLSRHVGKEQYTKEILPVSMFHAAIRYSMTELGILVDQILETIRKHRQDKTLHKMQTRSQTRKISKPGGDQQQNSQESENGKIQGTSPEPSCPHKGKMSEHTKGSLLPDTRSQITGVQENLIRNHIAIDEPKRRLEQQYEGYLPRFDDHDDIRFPDKMLFRENQKLFPKSLKLRDIVRQHLPKQSELFKHLQNLDLRIFHEYDLPLSVKELAQMQRKDPYFCDILRYLENKPATSRKLPQKLWTQIKRESQDYVLINTILFRITQNKRGSWTTQLCVPQEMIPPLLYKYHDSILSAHQGIVRIYQTIKRNFFAPYLFDNIRKYVQCCHTCQILAPNMNGSPSSHLRIPFDFRPMKHVSMDIKVMKPADNGDRYILFCVCEFSNFVVGTPMRDATSSEVIRAMGQGLMSVFGPPELVIADQGTQFLSLFTQTFTRTLNIEVKFVSPGNHGSLRVERYIRSVSDNLRSILNSGKRYEEWPRYLWAAVYAQNAFEQEALQGYCAYELVMLHKPRPLHELGFEPIPDVDRTIKEHMKHIKEVFSIAKEVVVKQKLRDQQLRLEREKRKLLNQHVYSNGDLVYYYAPRLTELQTSAKKFQANWIGPLMIKQTLDKTHFLLSDLEGKELKFLAGVHVNMLKPCMIHCGTMHGNKLLTANNISALDSLIRNFPQVL